MENIAARLAELGCPLPEAPKPVAAYVPAVRSGNLIFTAGQLPFQNGRLPHQGKLGDEISPEQGYEMSKTAVVNALAAVQGLIGDLDKITRVVRIAVYVASTPEFTLQSSVANGASEILEQVFGDRGHHARSAIGVASLPLNAPVEVELIVEVA